MAEEKKPRTVADHVSGLKREPLSTGPGAYFFPLLPAAFAAAIVGFGLTLLYLAVVMLTNLFWMEDFSAYLFETDRVNMLGQYLCRWLVIQSVCIVAFGCVLVNFERRRESMS